MIHKETLAGFRLSPQQRLRWLSELPPPVLVLDIKGALDPERLQRALESQVALHEPLRMQLQPAPGLSTPVQVIHSSGEAVQWVRFEQDNNSANGQTGISARPGISAQLICYNTHHHRLRLELPPLSADRGTLLRLAQALASAPEVHAGAESETHMTYSQYAAWLYELQADEDAEAGRQYWDRICAPSLMPCEMVYRQGTDREQAAPQMALVTVQADPALTRQVDAFCKTHGYAPSELFCTAWGLLLQRLQVHHDANTTALTLAWMHDCREDYDELTDCWGLFSKALPLSCHTLLAGNFSDALARTRQSQEEACEWQEYYAIDSEPKAGQSHFGFEWGGRLSTWHCTHLAQTGSLTLEIVAVQALTQAFELLLIPELAAETEAPGYRLHLHYDPCSYTEQAAATLLEQYQSLLADALTNPSRPLSALSLRSPSFERLLQAIEAPQPVPKLTTKDLFPALFQRSANQFSDRIALCDRIRSWTYRDLDIRSNQLAHHLASLGMGSESRVALYIERSADMVMAMLAVLKSGSAFLPLETQQPAARALAMLEATSPNLILNINAMPAPCPPGITQLAIDVIDRLEAYPMTPPQVNIHPDNAAYLLFTSGSTGTPKGVVIEHRQLHHYVTSILARLSLTPGAKSALATSLAADLGYTLLFSALLSGGELHVIDRQTTMDPQAWAAYQTRHAIDHLKIVPSLLEAWLSHSEPAAVLPQKQLILGGEALSPALLKKIRACAPALQVFNHYGPTETTVGVMMHKTDPAADYRVVPLSDRLNHTQIYLLDHELKRVAPGQPGALYIAGPQLARGYLCERQTAERFIPNPFAAAGGRLYRTGDLARYRPDGAVELIGRSDRQVKIRGFRIELDEIETILTSLAPVHQAAVVCVPRGQNELQLFAFISLKPNQPATLAQIQGQLQDRLPDYMLPTLRLLDALPLLANGKLDRQSLCGQAGKILTQTGATPPRTPLEALLAGLWADVLGLEKVGVDDDFFILGGHSLAAVKLASRLQSTLSAPVTVNAVFSAPTVARFAALVRQDLKLSPLVDLSVMKASATRKEDQIKPALFCFHPSTGHVQDYRILAEPLAQWRLWGLQADYLTKTDKDMAASAPSVDTLAAGYVTYLRQQQPEGPYYLLGWSLGGLIAIRAAAHLERSDAEVAFVGVVDSQLTTESSTEANKETSPASIEALLQSAAEEFDAASQTRLRNLSSLEREALFSQLSKVERQDWIFVFCRWARQQGLQLQNDSWQHIEASLHHQAHTQRLIERFEPPRLNCALTVWWARETVAATVNVSGTTPVNWHALTSSTGTVDIIDSDHMNILKHPLWQQQLCEYLNHAHETYATIDEAN